MLLVNLSFNKHFFFSSQGKFPVLKKVMFFLFGNSPAEHGFYDPAGVLPLLFSFTLTFSPACPETALHGYSLLYP
jgi:hypothetical protein